METSDYKHPWVQTVAHILTTRIKTAGDERRLDGVDLEVSVLREPLTMNQADEQDGEGDTT